MSDTEGPHSISIRFVDALTRRSESHWAHLWRTLEDEIDEARLDDLLDYAVELFAIGVKSDHDMETLLAIHLLGLIPDRAPELRKVIVSFLRHFSWTYFKCHAAINALRNVGGEDLEEIFRSVADDPEACSWAREAARVGLKEIEEAKGDV